MKTTAEIKMKQLKNHQWRRQGTGNSGKSVTVGFTQSNVKQQARALPSESRLCFLAEEGRAVAEFVQARAACIKKTENVTGAINGHWEHQRPAQRESRERRSIYERNSISGKSRVLGPPLELTAGFLERLFISVLISYRPGIRGKVTNA